MTEIRLYNTATRSKEVLNPIVPGKVSMYVCGPTVYDRAHLGNGRAAVVFDTLYRLLRHEYGGENVTYVRNITDVDDKINAEAHRRRAEGRPGTLEDLIRERSDETTAWYLEDMAALGTLEPTHMPRATEYIAPMIAMIEGLIEKGHAYAKEGHVLFRVRSYEDYGKLSGRSVDDMIAGARVEVAPFKEDPMDFVLWKPSDDETPGWDSPWGRGRPGWHIECSAMAAELLGPQFDIHGGGNDLIFPHHENEIAQSRCMGHGFAKVWMHNEMLQVEGKKMSKSLGNFFTVRDLLDQGVPGEVIRFVMLSTHYRKPMDWTEEKVREAEKTILGWFRHMGDSHLRFDSQNWETYQTHEAYLPHPEVIEALSDDLNTPLAIAVMHRLAKDPSVEAANALLGSVRLLGLLGSPERLAELSASGVSRSNSTDPDIERLINHLLSERTDARKSRDFARADQIRDGLVHAGVEVEDTPSGPEWRLLSSFDPMKLEALK